MYIKREREKITICLLRISYHETLIYVLKINLTRKTTEEIKSRFLLFLSSKIYGHGIWLVQGNYCCILCKITLSEGEEK